MSKVLRTSVVVHDTERGSVVLTSGCEVPEWAEGLITNTDVYADDSSDTGVEIVKSKKRR